MKRQRKFSIQKVIALFLLAAVSVFIVPKELIHEFYHHDDSVDIACTSGCESQLSNEHQHCDILQLTTPPLYNNLASFSFSFVSIPFFFVVKNTSAYFADRTFSFYLRGPPSLI